MGEVKLITKYQDACVGLMESAMHLHRFSSFALEYSENQENLQAESARELYAKASELCRVRRDAPFNQSNVAWVYFCRLG